MTTLEIGGLCLLVFAVFHWLGKFAKLRAVLAFVGVCCVTGGFLGGLLGRGATWVSNVFGAATGWAIGVALPLGLVVVLGIIFIHDLHPKNGASKRTSFVGIALAALLVVGAAGVASLDSIPAKIQNGVSQTISTVQGR